MALVQSVPPGNNVPVRAKRSIACNFCRVKKVRCNGGNPCTNCIDHGETCISVPRRGSRLKQKETADHALAQRLARVEALLQGANDTSLDRTGPNTYIGSTNASAARPEPQRPIAPPPFLQPDPNPPGREVPESGGGQGSEAPITDKRNGPPLVARATANPAAGGENKVEGPVTDVSFSRERPSFHGERPSFHRERPSFHGQRPSFHGECRSIVPAASPTPRPSTSATFSAADLERESTRESAPPPSYKVTSSDTAGDNPDEKQEGNSVYSGETSNWEYHGPRSFMSICSKPGVEWVTEKVGVTGFAGSASTLTIDITRRLKIEWKLSREQTPEPNKESAWRYIKVYFEEAPDAVFGIVHRPWFESRIRAHFEDASHDDDPSWFALRNVVYSYGCRLEQSKTKPFREAYAASWGWFENALSVHTEILHFRSSVVSVQALALMAYFSDGLGSPCLEYMLCTNALGLACAKGLHRQAVSSWNLTAQESCHRNWLFWAIYCLEKHISCRSGRPSIINDEDINCQVPTTAPARSSVNITYGHMLIKFAQLSSAVVSKLSSVRAFRQKPEVLVKTVCELDEQLHTLKSSVQPILTLDTPLDAVGSLPSGITLQQALYLHFAYYCTILDIHTALTLPWSRSILGLTRHHPLADQIKKSAGIVAKTSRIAILATKHVHIDANTPVSLAYFGPLYALINLFIHILQHPELPSAQSDLALMDIGAAHFARLEFATDAEISMAFVKEIAALARTAVRRAKTLPPRSIDGSLGVRGGDPLAQPPRHTPGAIPEQIDIDGFEGNKDANFFDLELENWSTFLPVDGFGNTLTDFFVP